MSSYIVTDLAGVTVKPGDQVVGGRGRTATFEKVMYGPEFTGTARIRVNGFEYCPEVWGLKVEVAVLDVSCRSSNGCA